MKKQTLAGDLTVYVLDLKTGNHRRLGPDGILFPIATDQFIYFRIGAVIEATGTDPGPRNRSDIQYWDEPEGCEELAESGRHCSDRTDRRR
jgi:hypothetical protein